MTTRVMVSSSSTFKRSRVSTSWFAQRRHSKGREFPLISKGPAFPRLQGSRVSPYFTLAQPPCIGWVLRHLQSQHPSNRKIARRQHFPTWEPRMVCCWLKRPHLCQQPRFRPVTGSSSAGMARGLVKPQWGCSDMWVSSSCAYIAPMCGPRL